MGVPVILPRFTNIRPLLPSKRIPFGLRLSTIISMPFGNVHFTA